MIFWQLNYFSASAQGWSRVSCIGHVNWVFDHENDISRTTHRIYNFAFPRKRLKAGLDSDFFELLFTLLSIEKLVKLLESLLKCLFIIGFEEMLILCE